MSGYIEADKTLEYLNLMYDKQNDMDEPYNCAVLAMINHIKNKAPSIDIVRCKECKHHFYDELNDCKMCYIHEYGETWEDDDFCSYGEREDE